MRKACTLQIFAALVVAASTVSAQEEEAPAPADGFGHAGQIVLDDVVGFTPASPTMIAIPATGTGGLGGVFAAPAPSAAGISYTRVRSGGFDVASFQLQPSIDLFVVRGLSLGAEAGVGHTSVTLAGGYEASSSWSATFAPRIGYAFAIADDVAFWPRLRAGVTVHEDAPAFPAIGPVYRASVDAPIVFTLSRHVVVDLGPDLAYTKVDGPPPSTTRTIQAGVRGGLSLTF